MVVKYHCFGVARNSSIDKPQSMSVTIKKYIKYNVYFRFWRLNPAKASSLQNSWDVAISSASEEYKHRMVS